MRREGQKTPGTSKRKKPQKRPLAGQPAPKQIIALLGGVGLCSMLMLWGMVSLTTKRITNTGASIPRVPESSGNWDVPTTLIHPLEPVPDEIPEYMQVLLNKRRKALLQVGPRLCLPISLSHVTMILTFMEAD